MDRKHRPGGTFRPRQLTWLWVVAVAFLGGCAAATTPTPTPTPVPTSTPVTTPTPEPLNHFDQLLEQRPGAAELERSRELLALVPASYRAVAHINVAALGENPDLRQALGLEQLGPAGALLPLVSNQLSTLVIASSGSDGSTIAVFDGPVNPESLVQLARGLGVTVAPEPESYREYQIWQGDAFGLVALALAQARADTLVVVQAPLVQEATVSPAELVKDSLDSLDNPANSLVAIPPVERMVAVLPLELLTLLYQDCRGIAELTASIHSIQWDDCTGAAISLVAVDGETLTLRMLWTFQTGVQAATAALLAVEGIALGGVPLAVVDSRTEGAMLQVQATGEATLILDTIVGQVQR